MDFLMTIFVRLVKFLIILSFIQKFLAKLGHLLFVCRNHGCQTWITLKSNAARIIYFRHLILESKKLLV